MVSDDAIAAARESGASDLFAAFVRRASDHELARDLKEEYEANPSEVGRVATDAFGRAVWTGELDEARRRGDEDERAVLDHIEDRVSDGDTDADGFDTDADPARYEATRDGEATEESPRDGAENHDAA